MGFGTCVPDNAVSVLYLCCPMSFRLSFAATSRTENITQFSRVSCFCSCITNSFMLFVYSAQHMLSVACSEAAKRQNTKKRIYSSNNRGSGKWKPQILLGISGRSFPQTACGKFSEKWKAFSTREKWKVCGVENKSLWKNRGKPAALEIPLPQVVENTFHNFLPRIPQARFYSCQMPRTQRALFLHMNFQQTVETHVENLLMPVEFLWNRQKSTAKSCFPHVLQCPFPVLYA